MSHEPAPQRPLHHRAGLHRVVANETVVYLLTGKIHAVYEEGEGTSILLEGGGRIRVDATAHDVLEGIADARAELEREDAAAHEAWERRRAARAAAFDAARQGTN